MNKLVFTLVALVPVALSTHAQADKTCARTGKPLIAETHKGLGIDVGDAGFELYASGAYHFYRHDPKAMASADTTGCITDQELADVKAALAKATWTVTTNAITCDAISIGYTEWAAGKHAFRAELCGHESIDATTQKALALVTQLEARYTPKSR